jgi:hypothetical protein
MTEAYTAFTNTYKKLGVTSAKFQSISEAKAALEPIGFADYEFYQWACVPENPASREAFMWLKKFFSLVGECAPNADFKVQIPGIYTKESVHTIYHRQVTTLYSGNEHDALEIRPFEKLWLTCFPNVTISKYCQVRVS